MLDKKIETLAYPYGRYNDAIIEITRRAGYLCARTTGPLSLSPIQNPFKLKVTLYTDPHALRDILKAIRRLELPTLLFKPWLINIRFREERRGIYDARPDSSNFYSQA